MSRILLSIKQGRLIMEKKLKRLQFDLNEETLNLLEKLMDESGSYTKKDVFNNALAFLEWAAKEVKAGRVIASVDEKEKSFKEITMPFLSNIMNRAKSRVA